VSEGRGAKGREWFKGRRGMGKGGESVFRREQGGGIPLRKRASGSRCGDRDRTLDEGRKRVPGSLMKLSMRVLIFLHREGVGSGTCGVNENVHLPGSSGRNLPRGDTALN